MLLENAGIPHECVSPAVNEKQIIEKLSEEGPQRLVEELSRTKALSVKEALRDSDIIVIGADTVVTLDGIIFGKPKDRDDAREMIRSLQGRSHDVFTGVSVLFEEESITFHVKSEVTVYEMSDEEIEDYLDTKEPYDKAGAYGIQGYFSRFIERIEGSYDNIVGLPVAKTYRALLKAGAFFGQGDVSLVRTPRTRDTSPCPKTSTWPQKRR